MKAAEEAPRWSTEVVVGEVAGHPCRMYSQRPHSMAELLLDARRWSGRPFLVQGDRRLSGSQHLRAVARAAAGLRSLGLRSQDRVMLTGFNRIEWLVAFWALQCVGAMAALGNAWWSEQEAQDALEQLRPSLLITEKPYEGTLPEGCRILRFEQLAAWIDADANEELVLDPVDEEAPAVVIFSSGTTGKAKGVVMSHRGVVANIQNVLHMTGRLPSALPPDHPGTVSLVTMPLFHLGGFQTSIMTMLSGGVVVFLKGRFDPLEALELMQTQRVRAWGSVPTMVLRVMQHERFADFDTSSISSVQMGGAPVSAELRDQVAAKFPASRRRVGSMYGLTEAGGVLVTGAGDDIRGRPGCVGRALPTVEIRIGDPDSNGVGEILARAPTAVRGYLGDPTPITDAQGWLSTGDLGRLDDEGRLYVVGRSKDMIIRGGENVASVHVENVLRTHPAVAEAAVLGLPHPDLGEEVAAVVVLKPAAAVDAAQLKAHAALRLARFELPSRWWITREALPVNATGKVMKRELLARWPQAAEAEA